MPDTGALLVAGTTSDAGKSVLTTALCRAFARRGQRVTPFKAQNMSNNSMVCADGGEIGRAQWVQARAARVEPETAMNPVLLKPGSDRRSHVVLGGRPAGTLDATDFVGGRERLARAAYDAFDDLRGRFDLVVAEGAGSPAEINLREGDYVNLGLARHGDVPVVVVGDIDRGGVFAALFGTVALLEPADQRLVAGFVMNKFRGEVSLLRPGIEELTGLTGRPTYGVLPWHPDLWLDSEDALDLDGRQGDDRSRAVRVSVVRLPRISNFTDVDALGIEPGVDVAFASRPRALADADLVVLPGTRATLADLDWLRATGLDVAILEHARRGGAVLGICGGFQLLGRRIEDPDGVEVPAGASVAGLGLLDVVTRFGPEKVLRRSSGHALEAPVDGYEIHHGRIEPGTGEAFCGGVRAGRVFGTMWHGCLEGDAFRSAFLRAIAPDYRPSGESFAARREGRLELLADLAEEHLDVEGLLALAAAGAPAGLPTLPPGDRRG